MDTDQAVKLTQDKLAQEGGTMGDLLARFRSMISPVLIGDHQWERILQTAGDFPIIVGALPFGFELPLHESQPIADLGVSLSAESAIQQSFAERARVDGTDETAKAVLRLFDLINAERSQLREIVGQKMMLEYDIGSAQVDECPRPGMFMRPGERPIVGACDQTNDVIAVADALVSSVGWELQDGQRKTLRDVYLAQPEDTRLDAFGIFPSRSRSIRLAIMGFKSRPDIHRYLETTNWPGELSDVDRILSRFMERVKVVRTGVYLDVQENGLSPDLGLTLIVRQRYTKESRYWLDGMTDWDPFLQALGLEDLVSREKLAELGNWVSKPVTLFSKSGQFVLLRGIHHIKLVISENQLKGVKAYVFFVLSGTVQY
ncbi:MAG: hypothetical protein OXI60_06995 [Acidiferrobacterales bacterium]|nr:hypothetical protein [Acidiferrobacterales bacterium]